MCGVFDRLRQRELLDDMRVDQNRNLFYLYA